MNQYLNPLSRALVAIIFIVSGIGKVVGFNEMVAVASSAGLPLPAVSIAIAALIEIAGGLALLAGWQVRWASLALVIFLIPTTLLFHAAHLGDPGQGRTQMVEVLKNLAIMGGLLKFYVDASGKAASVVTSHESEVEDFRARRAS
jgi:putative oxidoreductase